MNKLEMRQNCRSTYVRSHCQNERGKESERGRASQNDHSITVLLCDVFHSFSYLFSISPRIRNTKKYCLTRVLSLCEIEKFPLFVGSPNMKRRNLNNKHGVA